MKLPKLAIAAASVALATAALTLLSAIVHPFFVLAALVPAIAGITILRGRVWGAYGFALFECSQLALLSVALQNLPRSQAIGTALASFALVVLFFFAGRSLAKAGAQRGAVLPWVALCCLLTVPFFFVRAFVMPSGSMEDTILIGDRFLVRTVPRVNPQRGDIVVFHYPADRSQIFVKRIIGIPGDRIRMQSQVVYRNGKQLVEPYVVHKFKGLADAYRDNVPAALPTANYLPGSAALVKDMLQHHVVNGEVVVPAGKYFVLGDNRDNSLDSRYWGFLDSADIIGKPLFIYDSETVPQPDAPRKVHYGSVRWKRLFHWL